jgi:signal transduction histidine kinase
MKPNRRLAAAFLLALMVAGLGFEARAEDPCRRPGTPLEAKALAEKAVDHMAEVGAEQAFTDFMSPRGDFLPFDLYVFVFDRRGRLWVNGRFPGLIGSTIAGDRNANDGPNWAEAMRRADKDGSAWIEYAWYNPCSGRAMPKSSHIIKAGPFFVGVGAYGKMSA